MALEKQRRVLEAANEMFFRYGYRRTTMGGIAKAAGMSRPALYLVYPCKEEIFKARGYRLGDSLLYINPGTNYWGIPLRVGTPPEVTVLTLGRGAAHTTTIG